MASEHFDVDHSVVEAVLDLLPSGDPMFWEFESEMRRLMANASPSSLIIKDLREQLADMEWNVSEAEDETDEVRWRYEEKLEEAEDKLAEMEAKMSHTWKCSKCWEDNVLAHGDGATDLACTFCGQIHKVEVQTVVTVTARSEPPHER